MRNNRDIGIIDASIGDNYVLKSEPDPRKLAGFLLPKINHQREPNNAHGRTALEEVMQEYKTEMGYFVPKERQYVQMGEMSEHAIIPSRQAMDDKVMDKGYTHYIEATESCGQLSGQTLHRISRTYGTVIPNSQESAN